VGRHIPQARSDPQSGFHTPLSFGPPLFWHYRPFRCRNNSDFLRFLSESSAMIDAQAALRLPLVHHLVQHRMLYLAPWMSRKVPAADGDLEGPTGPDLHRELAQAGAHAAGKPDRDLTQFSTEVPGIQLLMQRGQAV
jgi:hypothetical protein